MNPAKIQTHITYIFIAYPSTHLPKPPLFFSSHDAPQSISFQHLFQYLKGVMAHST